MDEKLVVSHEGVTLIGGGPVLRPVAGEALALAPRLVAADGGADRALKLGLMPEAVIGDLDSLSRAARVKFTDRLHRISEQETTDFDKALRHISAPFCLGIGFSGGRLDHELAVLNALVRNSERACLILSASDVIFAAPPGQWLTLTVPTRSRVSLFPLAPLRVESRGLRWPTDEVAFAPGGAIGTSNQAAGGAVTLRSDAAGLLVILPRAQLAAALAARVPAAAHGK